jgi:hypothetical protein
MKTILEVFYLRIVGRGVRYRRREVNLSRKGSDPDELIWSLIRKEHDEPRQEHEEHEFVVHSTSWRYERPGKVILTYVAYSDELEFKKGMWKSIALSDLRTITKRSRTPRSRTELERKVVSHAMRHIAFLIKTDKQIDFKRSISPETMEKFERLWVSLAGRVL